MLLSVFSLLMLIFVLLSSFYFAVNTIFLGYSLFSGAPFVKTRRKVVEQILEKAQITENTYLIDLGCGDGGVLRMAATKYNCAGLGVDINSILIARAKIASRLSNITKLQFKKQSVLETDLHGANVVYMFLLPKLLEKMKPKLLQETAQNTLIISHAFTIPGWDEYIIDTLHNKPYNTYFYRISQSAGQSDMV